MGIEFHCVNLNKDDPLADLLSQYLIHIFIVLGCSKCMKKFPRDDSNTVDYSGTAVETPRDGSKMKEKAKKYKNLSTKTKRQEKESKHGIRYSELHRLPYFDPVRMHAIDAMHNLFLGIAKHFFVCLINKGILTNDKPRYKLDKIDERQAQISIPSNLGRVSASVGSNYKNMKADEWKVCNLRILE